MLHWTALDEDALVRILTEPKNSLISQYKKLFQLDKVELEFEPEALRAIAKKTIERHTGARGLRSVVEGFLTGLMYNVPSDYTVEKVTITADTVSAWRQAADCLQSGAKTGEAENLGTRQKRPKRHRVLNK